MNQLKRPTAICLSVCLTALFGLSLSGIAAAQTAAQTTSPVAPLEEPATGNKAVPKKVAKAQTINGIAVVVNDEVITNLEVAERINNIERSLKAQGTPLPARADLEKQIIERMIIDRLQIQLAKEQGMRVDDLMLDRALQRMAEQNKTSLQEMRNQIEREGTSFGAFREEIRDDIMTQRIREREVDSKLQVSELEVDNFIAAQEAAPNKNQEINLGHIMVRIPENATPEVIAQRNARVQEVYKKLRIGDDFAKLAATYSDSNEALKGGEVGWREQDKIPTIFSDAVNKITFVGGFSEIVRSPNGFHIFKLLGKRDLAPVAAASTVQETNVRHILMRPTQIMTAAQVKSTLVDLKQKIVSKSASFEELAKTNSIDTSASKGGDLGWVLPGVTFPEFEAVMNKLAVNEVSDPVETQMGFHILQVLDRKVSDDSKERKRVAARNAVRARKSEEALQDWLRQLRDRAYVEFRNEKK
ncbi:peptidylprolyl isomerase [Undibacterium fentianense]|uniref:Chaperone SurA n=1 Tax=Undibacterium fentianense TaxID=2828728 RepID=A0A941E6L8_9BURK|nr:peptidylprolyl isomerase [Undibacterium fentianense]MBR7799688.1 peptidylprolyl isomerase [Undibacterium fentianense]